MDIRKKNTIIKFLNIFFAIIFFAIYIIMYSTIDENNFNELKILKFTLSWIGILIYFFSIYSWYKINKKILDLYTIMFTFLMLFNYGQCFLWAFNIHADGEIGTKQLFNSGIIPNDREIVLAQLLTLINIFMFNLGAIFCYKSQKTNSEERDRNINEKEYIIYKISKKMSWLVVPITFIQLFNSLIVRIKYGYASLYYGEHVNTNLIQELFSRLFFVCIFGLLIGSKFKKNTRNFVYITFLLYIIISTICGDRGGWIFALCILFFLHNNYVKKISFKSLLLICVIGVMLLNVISSFVTLRNENIDLEAIKESLRIKKSPIVSEISEMGASMSIQIYLIMKGYNVYPYGNTHIFSILGIISDKVIKFLGFEYIDLSTWFSKYYLGLKNWGAGFSIVGEALINYGPYFSPIIMIILGWITASLVYLGKDTIKETPLKNMFSLIACVSLIPIFRGVLSYNLKVYFYRIVVFYSMYLIFSTVNKKNMKGKKV